MGGKQKQAQRTKNNARPSSSGRSAELLGSTIPQFTGFSIVKDTPFTLPAYTLAAMDDIDGSIDSSFQLVLKKMNKKDSTTKLKALQEFADLVKSSDQEAVKAILVFWARVYCLLATDIQHKVREATHLAHNEVVLKVKRSIAPQLKQIIGPWFTSQYDIYPTVASAAVKSFEGAFPKNKNQEAIIFCQEEILNYIYENLMVHTAESMNTTNASEANAKEKYEIVVHASLRGYVLYFNKVNQEAIEKVLPIHQKIISHEKFWQFTKSKQILIVSGWFNVITTICQRAPYLLKDVVGKVTNSVFQKLDDDDPTIVTSVWEAALLTMTTLDNWWTHINVQKLLLPKLYDVLSNAGKGSAAVIFPNLLPFLSHLPPNIDVQTFYFKYFDNLCEGLKVQSTLASRSESSTICITFIECLQYVIMVHQSDVELCEKLISTELIPTIRWCFDETQSAYKSLFNRVSNLVQYWHRNRNESEFLNYQKYLLLFWNGIENLFKQALEEIRWGNDKENDIVGKQIEFLTSLKHITKPKKQLKVQFSSEQPTDTTEFQANQIKAGKCDKTYLDWLNLLAFKVCSMYVKTAMSKMCKEIIDPMYSLITEFESAELFRSIVDCGDDLHAVYNHIFYKWLVANYFPAQPIIGMTFILVKYLKDDEKRNVLASFETLSRDMFGWGLEGALSHPHNKDRIIQEWLSNGKVDDYLVSLAEQAIDKKSTGTSNLLKMAFAEGEHGELFVSVNAVSKVVDIICRCLRNPGDYYKTLDDNCSFAAYLCSVLYNESNKLKYGKTLLINVFTMLCNNRYDKEMLTSDTRWEMQTAVHDALEILSSNVEIDITKQIIDEFSTVIEAELLNHDHFDIDLIYDLIVGLIKSLSDCEGLFPAEAIFNRGFVSDWRRKITEIWTTAEYINGSLASPYERVVSYTDPISDDEILKFFNYLLLRTRVFATDPNVCENDENYVEDEEPEEVVESSDEKKLIIDGTSDDREILAYLLYDYTLSLAFAQNYKTIKIYEKLTEITKQTLDYLNLLTTKSDSIEGYLLKQLTEQNWLWARVAYVYHVTLGTKSTREAYDWYSMQAQFTNNTSLARIHMAQVFNYFVDSEEFRSTWTLAEELINLRCSIGEMGVQRIGEMYDKIEQFKRDMGVGKFYSLNFANWKDIEISTEILRFSAAALRHIDVEVLEQKHWDFIVVSVASWTSKMTDIKVMYKSPQISAFISALSDVFVVIESTLKKIELTDANAKLIKEWRDVFAQDVHTDFLEVFSYISEQFLKSAPVKVTLLPFFQHFGKVIQCLNYKYIFGKAIDRTPKWSTLVKQSCTLLIHQCSVFQLWGYEMLKVLSLGLIAIDSESVKMNMPHEKGLIFEQFKDVLKKTQDIVLILLADMKTGENSCRVEPFTDSYTYTFAYVLLWDLLLTMCEKSSTELRYQYADWLRNQDFLAKLLDNVFKLMPVEVLHYNDSKTKPFYDYFVKRFDVSMSEPITSAKLERIVCWVFAMTLSQLPASVRQWWSNAESRISQVVERVTSAYVSPQLCAQELADVAQHETRFRNMVIKVHPTVREVVAIYTVDDCQMDLVITLPTNYPLGGPDVQCNRQIGGTSHKQWLMQLNVCLRHQNGRIWDGLSLWNNNLNKKFDGVEECYICFAVLHPGTYQLPKLSCQTCRKKFHSACLYKWFSTSNKSTCPICRNLF